MLSDEKEIEIIKEYLNGDTTQEKIAKKYGIDQTTVSNIINKKGKSRRIYDF